MNRKILLFIFVCGIFIWACLILFVFDRPYVPQLLSDRKDTEFDSFVSNYSSEEKTLAEEWLSAIEEEPTQSVSFTATGEHTPASLCRLLVEKVQNNQTLSVVAISRELIKMGDNAVSELVNLLNNENPTIQSLAMGLLVQIGTPEAVGIALGKLLTTHRDSPTRAVFIRLFTSIQSPAIPEVLIRIIGEAKDETVRDNVTEVLLSLNPYYVLDSLVRAIEHSSNRPQSTIYAIIMAQLANPSLIPAFQYIIENNTNPVILWGAAMGLANIGGTVPCEILAKNISSGDRGSALCAKALSTVKSQSSLPILLKIAGDPKRPPTVRIAAIQAFGNYSNTNIILQLQRILIAERDKAVKATLQEAITRITTNAKVSTVPSDIR